MNYDEALQLAGPFGWFQISRFIIILISNFFQTLVAMSMVFLTATPEHHCREPVWAQELNLTSEGQLNISVPWEFRDNVWRRSECVVYENITSNGTRNCNSWVYSTEVFKRTIVTDFDLVCDDQRLFVRSLAESLFFAGRFVGAIVAGIIADSIGRRPTWCLSIVLMAAVATGSAFAPTLAIFYTLYFMQGFAATAATQTNSGIGSEMVGPSQRRIIIFVNGYIYTVGMIALGLLAWAVQDWRQLQFLGGAPSVLTAILVIFLPESGRWLLAKGRKGEAVALLRKTARVNRRHLPENAFEELEAEKNPHQSQNVLDLLRRREMAFITLNAWFQWFTSAFVYYGINLNIRNLSGNTYLNYIISAAIEIPGNTITLILVEKVGRKKLFCVYYLLGGATMIATAFVPTELGWLTNALSLVGRVCISSTFTLCYLISSELFPTPVRMIGLGSSSMMSRLSSMVAPQVVLLGDYLTPAPFLIFGVVSLIAGGLALFLPETLGQPLPQTIEDAINLGRRDKQKTKHSQGSDEDHVSGLHKSAYLDSAGVNTSNAGDSDPKHWMTDWDYRLSYILTTQQC